MAITITDTHGNKLELAQWEVDRELLVNGTPAPPIGRFAHPQLTHALVVNGIATGTSDIWVLPIPNLLLQLGGPVFLSVVARNDGGELEEIISAKLLVKPRQKPQDYEYRDNYGYINWVQKAETVDGQISEIQTKLENGEFIGPQGPRGYSVYGGPDTTINYYSPTGLYYVPLSVFADVKPGDFIVGNYGGKYGMFAVESLSSANARGSTFTQLQGEDGQDGQNGQDGDQGPRGYRGFGVYGGPSVTLSEEGGYVSTSDESAAGAGIDDFIYGMLGDVYGMFKVTALTTTKRSGETFVPLKGEDGAPGQDGQDGAQGPRGYRGYGIYGSAGIPLTYTSSGNCTIAPEYAGEAGIGDFVIGTISGGTHSGKLCLAKITSYQSSPEHLFLCSYKVIQGADGQDGQDGQDGAQGPRGYGVYGGAGITLTHTNSNYCSVLMADVPDAIKGDFVIGTISGGTHSGKLCIAKITGGSSTGLHYSCSYTPIQGSDGGGGSITVDSSLSDSSENPVQNKVIKTALDAKGTYSKPSGGIPDTDIASAATWNAKGTYSKPSGGIPASDLASAVQTSLGKADTALQSYTETDPTVPSWAKAQSKPSYTASEVGAIAAPSSPAVGAFLVWNGSAWTAQTLSAWNGGSY